MKISQDETNGCLKIAGTLGIGCAGELGDALADYLQQQTRPAVDLSEVEECDTAALQLFCAASKSAARKDKPFRVVAASAPVNELCDAIGLSLAADGKQGDDGAA